MSINQALNTAYKLLDDRMTQQRIDRLVAIYERLSPRERRNLRLDVISHGGSSWRYGMAACRRGRCERIGYELDSAGGRCQLWAVWSDQ